jgi:hypothetical protein
MIDHVWSVLCSSSSVDRDSNNISLFNIVEQLTVEAIGPPPDDAGLPLRMEVVSLWVRRNPEVPARAVARVVLESPGRQPKILPELDLDLTAHERLRTVARFDGLPISASGRHYMVVEYQASTDSPWQEAARIPLQVAIHFETPNEAPPDS